MDNGTVYALTSLGEKVALLSLEPGDILQGEVVVSSREVSYTEVCRRIPNGRPNGRRYLTMPCPIGGSLIIAATE